MDDDCRQAGSDRGGSVEGDRQSRLELVPAVDFHLGRKAREIGIGGALLVVGRDRMGVIAQEGHGGGGLQAELHFQSGPGLLDVADRKVRARHIQFDAFDVADADAMAPLIRDYQQLYPDVTVVYHEYVTTALFDEVAAACAAGPGAAR